MRIEGTPIPRDGGAGIDARDGAWSAEDESLLASFDPVVEVAGTRWEIATSGEIAAAAAESPARAGAIEFDLAGALAAVPAKLFFRIGEVAELLGVKTYVLRFWETEFPMIHPKKSRSGQRVYRRKDVESLLLIKHLLYVERFSIEGARKRLRELKAKGSAIPAAAAPDSTSGTEVPTRAVSAAGSAAESGTESATESGVEIRAGSAEATDASDSAPPPGVTATAANRAREESIAAENSFPEAIRASLKADLFAVRELAERPISHFFRF